jgi:putative phosphoribosyl transferase
MTTVIGEYGSADPAQLEGRNIIIVTDGVKNGLSFDAAFHFLDRIHVEKRIAAIPVGPGEVIERLNQRIDEMHYLYIPESFFTVSHYYTDEDHIDASSTKERLDNIVARWN